MSTESLVRNLVSTYSFQAVYRKALLSDVTEQLTSIQITLEEAPPSREEWSYLLKVANILMLSSYREEQDRFLRLAQSCLKSSTSPVYLKSYAVDLLQQAANFPAISLAKSRKIIPSVEVEGERSSAQILAEQRVINKNTIYSQAGEKFICNGFQQAVWDSYHDNFITSASAPTAAGKSWILYQLIAEQVFSNESFEVLYLVPTRALINQVSSDLSAIFDRLQADAEIITLPIPNSEIRSDRRVYVFTQERLNLLSNQVGFSKEFNLVLVDEAHKVGDSYVAFCSSKQFSVWLAQRRK